MSDAWGNAGLWGLRMALGGGLLLLGAWALTRGARQPARQQRLGEGGMAAALFLAALSITPAWLIVTLPASPEPAPLDQPVTLAPALPSPTPTKTLEELPSGIPVAVLPDTMETEPMPALPIEVGADRRAAPASVSTLPGASEPTALAGPARQAGPTEALGEWIALHGWTEGQRLLGWGLLAWSAGAILVVLHWLVGYLGLLRLLNQARPASAKALQLLARMTVGRRTPRLLVSDRIRMPLSCGLLRPTILLPVNLCKTADPATLRWVLAHELSHLERGDTWSTVLFAVGQVVFYFVPCYWWLRRQVRLCQEYVADAAAVAQHRQPEDYAQFLLSLVRAPAVPAGATGASGQSSDLLHRVTMLLQAPAPVERRWARWLSLALAPTLVVLAVMASGIGLQASAPAPEAEDEPASIPTVAETFVPEEAEPQPPEEKKDEPKRAEPEAQPPRKPEMPDIEELLKRLAKGLDPQQAEQIRKELEKVREEFRKAIEKGRQTPTSRSEERRLGVRLDKPNEILADQLNLPKGQGLVIEQVLPDTPAAKAGLKANDILLELNGKMVSSEVRELAKLLDDIKPGTAVEALVLRKGKRETIKELTLPEAKPPRRPSSRLSLPRNLTSPNTVGPSTSMVRQGDQFTTRHKENGVLFTVTGTISGRKALVSEIIIEENDLVEYYDSLEEVPESYRERVKNVIDQSTRSSLARILTNRM